MSPVISPTTGVFGVATVSSLSSEQPANNKLNTDKLKTNFFMLYCFLVLLYKFMLAA